MEIVGEVSNRPASSSSSSSAPVQIDDLHGQDLFHYSFPSIGAQVWRYITSYSLADTKGTIRTIDALKGEGARLILRGELLPVPGSGMNKLSVWLYVNSFSVDHGMSPDDPSRGIWLSGLHTANVKQIYYKLQDLPADNYRQYGHSYATLLHDYFRLHDYLMGSYVGKEEIAETVQTIFERTKEDPKRSFNLDNIVAKSDFVVEHLSSRYTLGNRFKQSLSRQSSTS